MKSSFKRLQFDPFSCWLIALVILVAGCSSTTIKSQRLSAEAEPGKDFGIIYQMTKPQFTIATIEATDTTTAPKYTLNVEFVPDADRRFAVSSYPGIFSDSDLTVSLNSNGAMTGLTHTSREQITPTIKAVGDFTTSIIGAAAIAAGAIFLGATEEKQVVAVTNKELIRRLECYISIEKEDDLLKATPNLDATFRDWKELGEEKQKALANLIRKNAKEIKKSLEEAPKEKNFNIAQLTEILKPKSEKPAQVHILKALAEPGDFECDALKKEELIVRLDTYIAITKDDDLLSATPGLDDLVPNWYSMKKENREKRAHELADQLRASAAEIKEKLKDMGVEPIKIAQLTKKLDPQPGTAQVNIMKVLANPADLKFDVQKTALKDAKLSDDPAINKKLEWERELVVNEVEFARKNEDLLTLFGYSGRVLAEPWMDNKAAKKLMNEARELSTIARLSVLSTTTFPNLLGPLIKDKTPAQQIYQVVKEKQEEIAKNKASLVKQTDPIKREEYRKEIEKLTLAFHETIGAADEYDEILMLQKKIKEGPPKAAEVGHSSPFQEYAAARNQLVALNEAVTLKLGKVAADAAEITPAKKPEWIPALVEKAFCWNKPREDMEPKTPKTLLEPRILVPKGYKGPVPTDLVATRVALEYEADINSYPKYVVVIGPIEPIKEVKP